jgi:hypothetical protein
MPGLVDRARVEDASLALPFALTTRDAYRGHVSHPDERETQVIQGNSKYAHLLINVRKLKPGEAFIATAGIDFDCSPETMRGVVYQLAKAKGPDWHGTCSVVGKHVIYTFYRRTDYMRPNMAAYPLVRKMRGEQ